ncbi:MAG TPA: protein kinase [Gemmatimonadales bacterium]|nr:protein kinase [Gemmatimonadales bacterium]
MTSNPTPPTTCQRCGASLTSGTSFCPRCGTGIPVHRPWSGPTLATPSGAVLEPRPEASEAQLAALRRATLGQYEILVEVGRGGMATVYLAHDLALDRKVAIKVLAPALLAMGEGMVERFKREARTAAALSHPHIIPIFAVNEGNEVLYFVMKHVQGRSLDAIVRDVGQLPLTMTQAILAQVADALGYAHRHGVIHRDIKTANIMLDEEGWAVVTDFGIAKVMQAQGLTMTGVTVGTPTYMSPEQCATTEEVTGASDQYSLGVVAYEMLTGTVPFQDDSIMSIMYAHFNQPPRPVTELRPDCPPNLAAAVMRMLEKDPASRWPSMDDVVAVCGRPSLRRDDPIRQQMSSLARAAGHLVGPKTPSSPIALSRVRTRPTFRRPRRWLWPTVGAAVALGGALALWRLLGSGTPGTAAPVATVRDSVPAAAARPDSSRAVVRPVPSVAAQRDDSMIGSLRTSALRAAQRAALAGATPTDLSPGQTAFASGESLAAARRVAEAMMQFATASAQWADAERQAKARGTRDTAPRRVAESPPAQPAAPLPAPPPAPPPAPVPVASVAPDPRPEIEKVIADYATAIESRDIEQVRHAYPGLTTAQQGSWQTFFDRVRNLKATLTVANLSLTATTADAGVSGVYEYDNASTGRPERRPVTFRATLARDAGGWRITAIR